MFELIDKRPSDAEARGSLQMGQHPKDNKWSHPRATALERHRKILAGQLQQRLTSLKRQWKGNQAKMTIGNQTMGYWEKSCAMKHCLGAKQLEMWMTRCMPVRQLVIQKYFTTIRQSRRGTPLSLRSLCKRKLMINLLMTTSTLLTSLQYQVGKSYSHLCGK